MAKYILDTHALLWWISDDPQLSAEARAIISSSENAVAFSAASVWEVRIKERLGKISLPDNFGEILAAEPFEEVPVRVVHAHEVALLPDHHRDPFDRIIVAQARVEGMTLISRDRTLSKYSVKMLLA